MTREENDKPRGLTEHQERVIEAMRGFFGNKHVLNKGHRIREGNNLIGKKKLLCGLSGPL